ncbi:hypothetical protein VZT92_011799 [Zoarces viviparus]|uniref:Uncharacterized protein n=1 Tax=Zoarces viviparus TaxID=48416 RepID=A0AAW1F6H6_ZOAVI
MWSQLKHEKRYPKPDQLLSLVAVAVETGRMTQPHPTGFLGAVASALFTAYAVQRRPITSWGLGLLNQACPIATSFVQGRGYAVEEAERDRDYFCDKWQCDRTAVIACCCWGLLNATRGVPEGNYRYSNLEYRDRSAEQLYALSH